MLYDILYLTFQPGDFMKKILGIERKRIGNKLHKITTMYHHLIPLQDVDNVLREFGYLLLQEDNKEWSGFLCGREANTTFILGDLTTKNEAEEYQPIKTQLYFYWYKFEFTGRYEVNMYLI